MEYSINGLNTSISKNKNLEIHWNHIPKFFEKIDITDVNLKQNQQSRVLFLQKLSKESVKNDELQQLWSLLEKSVSESSSNGERIDYLQFKQIVSCLKPSSKLREFFTATTFARLLPDQDPQGRISILTLFNYIMRKIWMQQARVALSLWDSSGNGYLCENELENYIKELIPTLSKLNQMAKSYHPFYICVVVRKFFFFLDPYKFNKIKILDILCSGFLDQILELRNVQLNRSREDLFNWFSPTNTIRIYNTYLSLDQNQNGMISKDEFYKYGTFTSAFVDRLFEVCMTYNKEIDFKTFVNITLALENRKEIQSLYFFFPILDIDSKQYLDHFTLKYFFKPIEKQMKIQGQEPIAFNDFSNEIFDMVRPKRDSNRIYIEDLLSSGYSDTIISILIDLNGFYAFENRESNIHNKGNSSKDIHNNGSEIVNSNTVAVTMSTNIQNDNDCTGS